MSDAQWGELFSSEQARQQVDLFITDWYLSKPDPIGMYDNMLGGSVNNYLGFEDEEYNEAVTAAIGEYDEPTRAGLALRAQEIWMDNMLTVPLVMAPNTLVLSDDLTGVPVAVAYLSYPWAADLGTK
jgi:peptide/nickel transport system substrate-binding protein